MNNFNCFFCLIAVILLTPACDSKNPQQLIKQTSAPKETPLDLSLPDTTEEQTHEIINVTDVTSSSISTHLNKKPKQNIKFKADVLLDIEQKNLIDKVDGGKLDMEVQFE